MIKLNKILLIDDDRINNFIVINKLSKIDLVENIICVENGQEALDFLNKCIIEEASIPELILLDINMPVLDSWGFLEEFIKFDKRYQDETAIYMVSSSVYAEDIEKSKTYKCVKMFFSKPLLREKLEEIIQLRISNS